MDNIITFTTEEGEKVELFVLEEAHLNGTFYLLVTEDEDDEESVGYIMKQLTKEGSKEVSYEIVDNDKELRAVSGLFEELLNGEVDIVEGED